jgi:plastocyanin
VHHGVSMRRLLRASALWVLGLCALAGTQAAELRGHVTLDSAGGNTALLDVGDTVVIFKPDAPARAHPLSGDLTMTMHGKSFIPHVLPVTVGTTVRFPNGDPILHNVFSTSKPNDFDMGLYGHGDGKSRTFAQEGLVRVYCNVHHEMFAYILVLDTPYFTRVQEDGSFELRNLPAGPGQLIIWHPRTQLWQQPLAALSAAPLDLKLTVVRSGVPAHFNKLGKPYDKDSEQRY